MPSAKRRISNAESPHDSLFRRFKIDTNIGKLCEKMAENQALVGMGEELLKSLEDAGTTKFDARIHFETVEKIWQNGHFNYLLFKALEDQDPFLPAMIQDLSKQYPQEGFEERMSCIKEDRYQYIKSIVEVGEPAARMRGFLIILIMCWNCEEYEEDVHPDLDKEKRCTVAVKAPDDDDAREILERFESLLSSMKMNGATDDEISLLCREVESSGIEPREFFDDVVKATEKASDWLLVHGSPIPGILDELFIMELAVALDRKKNNHEFVSMAKLFLDKLHSIAIADDGRDLSPVGEELFEIAAKVLKDECFVDVLREKTEQGSSILSELAPYVSRCTKRESLILGDNAVRVARIKEDPFCARILEDREGAAVLRAFLIILIGYYNIADVLKLVVGGCCKMPRFRCVDYESGFAGDVEGLEKVVERLCLSRNVFEKLRRIQFQREVLHRQCCYDVYGRHLALVTDGSVLRTFERMLVTWTAALY